jgi:hypothetical protein
MRLSGTTPEEKNMEKEGRKERKETWSVLR